MTVYTSRHRITYTPEGQDPIILLQCGQDENAEPALTGGPGITQNDILQSAWAAHHSTGNARITLTLDAYIRAQTPAHAQAKGLNLWRHLTTHPEGTITYETAFLGETSRPLIKWQFRATLNQIDIAELNLETTPFADRPAAGVHASYTFTVSNPQES